MLKTKINIDLFYGLGFGYNVDVVTVTNRYKNSPNKKYTYIIKSFIFLFIKFGYAKQEIIWKTLGTLE